MKILYLNYSPSIVQQTRTNGIAEGLRKNGHDITVLNPHRNYSSGYNPKLVDAPKTKLSGLMKKRETYHSAWTIIIGEVRRFLANLRYLVLELFYIIKYKPDWIIARPGFTWSVFLSSKILLQKTTIDTDGPVMEIFEYMGGGIPEFYLDLERLLISQSPSVAVISTEMKRLYSSYGGDPDRIAVCPNAIDPTLFHHDIDSAPVKNKHGLTDKTTIGFMGNIQPWHGLPGLLNIFPEIAESYSHVHLLLIGLDIDWDEIPDGINPRLIDFKDRITCAGRIPHTAMPEYLKAIDVFVLPYPETDFFYFSPIKLFEAMGVGCAVVGADIGQTGEVIEDEKDGLLFPAGDYSAMKNRIIELIENPNLRNILGENASEKIRGEFTWEKSAGKMISAYEYSYGRGS
ncbi:MAG: glycosyltransferase [candidate division Zixibacteria bacterium]|nr:glycosyltransferase [candidate division Zixibacteria bacterium]